MNESSPESGASSDIDVDEQWSLFDVAMAPEIKAKLFEHQREGVRWLHDLHYHRSGGGILGDDMGLG